LRAEPREGLSGYLQAFMLIGVAIGASTLLFGAALSYTASIGGPSVAVEDASIRQGAYVALEAVTVVNSGPTAPSSFTVSTSGVSPSSTYCYTLVNPGTRVQISTTCPGASTGAGAVTVPFALPSGASLTVVISLTGSAFSVGETCGITVTTSAGGQDSTGAQVAPA
jgi:hypothetical protein